MLEISRIGCAVYLCILSVIDIWTRRIPLWFLAAGGAGAAAARICQTGTLDFSALAGAVTGDGIYSGKQGNKGRLWIWGQPTEYLLWGYI